MAYKLKKAPEINHRPNGKPLIFDIKLHDKQYQIAEALANKQYIISNCGRRFGKSFLAKNIVLQTLVKPNAEVAYIVPRFEYASKVYSDIKQELANLGILMRKGNRDNISLKTNTGSTFRIYSADGNKNPARGYSWDLVVIDEAALIKDLEYIIDSAIMPTLSERKGKLFVISTPKAIGNGFYKMWMKWKARSEKADSLYAVFSGTSYDNTTIDSKEWDLLRTTMPESIFNMEILAIPSAEAGVVFLDVEKVLIDAPSSHKVKAYGLDLGCKEDYTVITEYSEFDEVLKTHRFKGISWEVVYNKITNIITDKLIPIFADSTGVGQPICDRLIADGYWVNPIIWNQTNKAAMVNQLQLDIARNKIKLVRAECFTLVEELGSYEYVIGETGKVSYSAPYGLHDDCVSSLLMVNAGLHGNYMEGLSSIRSEEDFKVGSWSALSFSQNDGERVRV